MKLLLSIALVGWIAGVMYFFDSKKTACCAQSDVVVAPSAMTTDGILISFQFDRSKPDTSMYFHLLRDSLIGAMGNSNLLRITGKLSKIEAAKDSLLGLKRANATRALFQDYIDAERIEIVSAYDQDERMTPQFDIISTSKNITASLPMTKVTEPIVKETETEMDDANTIKMEDDESAASYVIYFDDNSSEMLSPTEALTYIRNLEQQVKQSKQKVIIEGFDDNGRSADASFALTKRRTWRVRKAFTDNYVRRKLLTIKNTGQTSGSIDPVKSRRVEITVSQ